MTAVILTRPAAAPTREQLRDELEGLLFDEKPEQVVADRLLELRPDLTGEQRWLLWEEFADAVWRLEEVRSDSFDPTQWDTPRNVIEALYDEHAEAIITTLLGDAGRTEATR